METAINVAQFATERITELRAMELHATTVRPTFITTISRLPVRFRRRAASHFRQLERSAGKVHASKRGKKTRASGRIKRRLRLQTRMKESPSWLATHIWHAKRFHMITKWNFRIPLRPTDKVLHATHRASVTGCLLLDLSYQSCIILEGTKEEIISGISQLSFSDNPPDKQVEGGRFWINLNLYKKNQYPFAAIGPVDILWRNINKNQPYRQLWIWCHPAIHEEIMREFSSVFSSSVKIIQSDQSKYSRFRFIGERSHRLLHRMLQLSNESTPDHKLWQEILFGIWSASYLPSRLAVRLNIACNHWEATGRRLKPHDKDFRWIESEITANYKRTVLPVAAVANHPVCTHDMDHKSDKSDLSSVPILLLHQPGCAENNLGSGWDIICRWEHARTFWHGFVNSGVEVGGLRELERSNLELQTLSDPEWWPDTKIGAKVAEEQGNNAKKKHLSRPLNRRVHYHRISVAYPFNIPWNRLVVEWLPRTIQSEKRAFFVLRNRTLLRLLSRVAGKPSISQPITRKNLLQFDKNLAWALVRLRIQVDGRGTAKERAMLCAPNVDDVVVGEPDEITELQVDKLDRNVKASEECASLIKSTTRDIIGFVTRSTMSLRTGRSVGEGYCSLMGLVSHCFEDGILQPRLWLRNIDSISYRVVKWDIVAE